jgi:hypothetical protein
LFRIPPHDGSGPLHVAFAVTAPQLAEWEAQLERCKVAIEGRTSWPRGGRSVYFRDPDGHLLELATPGVWKIYDQDGARHARAGTEPCRAAQSLSA